MRKIALLLVVTFALFHEPLALAQAPKPKPPASEAISGQTGTEIAVLRAQLEQARLFQDSLVNTVHWALGTVAGIAILLVSFGWYTNFRVYERDKAALEKDLSGHLEVGLAAARAALDERLHSVETNWQARVKVQADEVLSVMESKLAGLAESISTQVQAAVRPEQAGRQVLKRQVVSLNQDLLDIRRDFYRQQKMFRTALRISRDILKNAKELASDFWVSAALENINEDLADLLANKDLLPDTDDIGKLAKALEEVEGTHQAMATRIRDKVLALRA